MHHLFEEKNNILKHTDEGESVEIEKKGFGMIENIINSWKICTSSIEVSVCLRV
mgnify:CR=1 FL=1